MSLPSTNANTRGHHANPRRSPPSVQANNSGRDAPLLVDHPIMGGEIRRIVPRTRPDAPVNGAELEEGESAAGAEGGDEEVCTMSPADSLSDDRGLSDDQETEVDEDASPRANIFDLPQVQEGRARVFFELGGWSVFPAPPSSMESFIVTVVGRRHGEELTKIRNVKLPSTLAAARRMDFRAWNSFMQDIRRLFQDLLTDEQMDSLTNLVYVYLWFSRQALDDRGAHSDAVVSLWNTLQGIQTGAATMGVYLATPGEDLLMNVYMWALTNIPDAFPAPFPHDPNLQVWVDEDGAQEEA